MKMVETRQISEKKMAVSGYRVLELLKALTISPLTTLEMLQILEAEFLSESIQELSQY